MIHPPQLGKCRMRLIDDNQSILGQVFHQCRWGLSRFSAREVAGIIFNALAVSHLLHHFHIEPRPLFQPLCLKKLVMRFQFLEPYLQFFTYCGDGPFYVAFRCYIMTAWIDCDFTDFFYPFPAQRINEGY